MKNLRAYSSTIRRTVMAMETLLVPIFKDTPEFIQIGKELFLKLKMSKHPIEKV